jgi:hypothetical protein
MQTNQSEENRRKIRYIRNYVNRTGSYPQINGINSSKIANLQRRARLPESYNSAATTQPYSQSSSRSSQGSRTSRRSSRGSRSRSSRGSRQGTRRTLGRTIRLLTRTSRP